jgi:tRNA A-37 threonylcarbamoyl transferase component Bud32
VAGYEILSELGRGGMGVVYKARHLKLDRVVALKMILAGAHAGAQELARFRTEAEAVARLHHPNIVQIYEIGEEGGKPFLSLEYVEGGSLERKLNGTPLPPRAAAELVEKLARAVAAAHERGVIHRDLKPGNVLLAADGTPKVTDFGLAKKLDDLAGATQSGAILGTPSYMAPEQAGGRSKEIGPAADVYALGAILYECLTGRPPFKAATALETILEVLEREPVAPRLLSPVVPRDLETICLKCLEKLSARRYADAAALADDLGHWLRDEPIAARRPAWGERAGRWVRKQRRSAVLATVAAGLATLLVLGVIFGWRSYTEARLLSAEFTTDGPALTGELFPEGEDVVPVKRFSVPTTEPIRLRSGKYHLRLSKPGLLSETWGLSFRSGFFGSYDVGLVERQVWPPWALSSGAHLEGLEAVVLGGNADLFPVEASGQSALLRRINGATGKEIWQKTFSLDNAPPGCVKEEWPHLLQGWPPGPNIANTKKQTKALGRGIDLNGDGNLHVVWASRTTASLLALSAKDGSTLWWHQARPPKQDAAPVNKVRRSDRLGFSLALGPPLVLPAVPGKAPDLIATFEMDLRHPGEGGLELVNWVERIDGRTGRTVWQRRITGLRSPATLAHVKGRTVVVAAGEYLVGLDATSGRDAWPPEKLSISFAQIIPHVANPDGTKTAHVLLMGKKAEVEVWSLTGKPTRLWKDSPTPSGYHDTEDKQAISVPLPDGGWDVIAARRTQVGFSFTATRANGELRWEKHWGGMLPQHIGFPVLASGPDIDGDGFPDLFYALLVNGIQVPILRLDRHTNPFKLVLFVYARSGRDGRILWVRQFAMPWPRFVRPEGFQWIAPLNWWQPGPDGHPLLVVPLRSSGDTVGQTFVLIAKDGRLAHILPEVGDAQIADLNGDGLLDLYYTHARRDPSGVSARFLLRPGLPFGGKPSADASILVHAVRGLPAEDWFHRGAWESSRQPRDFEAVEDPLHIRILPWAALPAGVSWGENAFPRFVVGSFATVFGLLIPLHLLRRAMKRRSRWLALSLLPWFLALEFTLDFFEWVWPMNFTFPRSLWAVIFSAPFLLPPYLSLLALARAIRARRWRRLGLLLGIFLLVCVTFAAASLAIDRFFALDGGRYIYDGWYHIWIPGLYTAGLLLIAGWAGAAILRGIRAVYRRARGRRAATLPALAAGGH